MSPDQFCLQLASLSPSVDLLLKEHFKDFDEVLPHVFLGEITRYILNDDEDRTKLVNFIESNFGTTSSAIDELIAVSFVENLPEWTDFQNATRGLYTPKLHDEWNRQHS